MSTFSFEKRYSSEKIARDFTRRSSGHRFRRRDRSESGTRQIQVDAYCYNLAQIPVAQQNFVPATFRTVLFRHEFGEFFIKNVRKKCLRFVVALTVKVNNFESQFLIYSF